MTGSKLSQKVIKYLQTKYNAYVVNTVISSKSGTPDLLVCIKGEFFAFEIKGKNDRLSYLQRYTLDSITKAGGYAGVIFSLSDVDNLIINKPKIKFIDFNKQYKL